MKERAVSRGGKRVVDEPGSGHGLDEGIDRLTVDLVDPSCQPTERVDVGRNRELGEVLSSVGEQADTSLRRPRSNPACNM
jgi:hypothetical protein